VKASDVNNPHKATVHHAPTFQLEMDKMMIMITMTLFSMQEYWNLKEMHMRLIRLQNKCSKLWVI